MTDATVQMRVHFKRGAFDIDVDIDAGPGITALFGRSGAGKSTIVGLLAGLLTPDEGRIRVAGETLFDSHTGVCLPPQRRNVGCVFQDARLFPHMSVAKNLRYGINRLMKLNHADTFARVVHVLGLEELLERRPAGLSGGEQQRVAIGRALLSNPRLLLMDEPLASLDAARKNEIIPYIERLNAEFKIPVIYVSHAMEEVVRLADHLILLDKGRVKAHGGVEDILARLDLMPLTGRYEAGAVLCATVAGHDTAVGLTRLNVSGHPLFVPQVNLAHGKSVRLRVRARDVALALKPLQDTSILNQVAVQVAAVNVTEAPHAEIALHVIPNTECEHIPPQTILARITKKSYQDLGLTPGKPAYALIKAIAIDRHSLGGLGEKSQNNA